MGEKIKIFISPAQIRAARALLDWSQDELAVACKLSVATIRKLELGHISPRPLTIQTIRHVLEDSGLEFLEPEGVRHRPEDVTVYRGTEGLETFFDDLYQVARKKGGEFLCVCASEKPYLGPRGALVHTERMANIKDSVSVKCILTGDDTATFCDSYSDYRWLSKHYVNSVPFYVYDNRCSFFIFEVDPAPKIVMIQSPIMARAFRHQFYSMWEKATPLVERNSAGEIIRKVG
jgi:transcriptional regulator with XRE-family HTH domain